MDWEPVGIASFLASCADILFSDEQLPQAGLFPWLLSLTLQLSRVAFGGYFGGYSIGSAP